MSGFDRYLKGRKELKNFLFKKKKLMGNILGGKGTHLQCIEL